MTASIARAASAAAVLDLRSHAGTLRLDDVAVRVGGADAKAAATPLGPLETRFRVRLGPFDDRRWALVGSLNTERITLRYRRPDGVVEMLRTDASARARRMSLTIPANAYGAVVDIGVVYARRSYRTSAIASSRSPRRNSSSSASSRRSGSRTSSCS
jgi:hypothetical protein